LPLRRCEVAGRGFLISEVGFAATLAAAGLTLAFTPRATGTLEDATTYAIALGVVGLLNVAGDAYQLARGGSRARPST